MLPIFWKAASGGFEIALIIFHRRGVAQFIRQVAGRNQFGKEAKSMLLR